MAVFAAALYTALLVAVFGVLSLALDVDVIADPAAGPLVGPIMAGVAVAVVFFSLLSLALRVPEARQRVSPTRGFLIGAGAYVLYAISGGLLVAIGGHDAFRLVSFTGHALLSPFAITAGILAFVIALLDMLILAARVRAHGTPRWPWEHDDE